MRGPLWPLTARGTVLFLAGLVITVVGLRIGLDAVVFAGVVLALLVLSCLVVVWFGGAAGAVQHRVSPDVSAVGEKIEVAATWTPGAAPAGLTRWSERVPTGLAGRANGIVTRADQRIDRVTIRYELTGTARGDHSVGPLRVGLVDALGLARRMPTVGEAFSVLVGPEVHELPSLSEAAGESGGAHSALSPRAVEGADNLIARPYVPGDSLRRVHWRATAHRDELMVRQEEFESTPRATVIIDRVRPHQTGGRSAAADLEAVLAGAISVVVRLVRDGYAVALTDTSGTALVPDIADEDGIRSALAVLARLQSVHAAARVSPMAAELGPVVLLTAGRVDAAVDSTGSVAARSSLPVLLAVGPAVSGIERAAARGWRTGVVAESGAPALRAAWARAIGAEVTHGGS
ncbi:DUF58 domain-containing protein [Microbacterium sp. GXS0129]|uniref:DUF58 domain-containing protein n=1 Tax=Microbacterium sp. GXS0129 TaxID=3377836 RepID=UPI00383B409C